MRKKILVLAIAMTFAMPVYAGEENPPPIGEKQHLMQVHGAVCPSCAYGLEKKFMKMEGVGAFDVDFKAGIISVCTNENVSFTEEQLTTLFKESGYTYKGEEVKDECTL